MVSTIAFYVCIFLFPTLRVLLMLLFAFVFCDISFIFFLKDLFIDGCTGSSLLRQAFSSCKEQGPLSHCASGASHCSGFSCAERGL